MSMTQDHLSRGYVYAQGFGICFNPAITGFTPCSAGDGCSDCVGHYRPIDYLLQRESLNYTRVLRRPEAAGIVQKLAREAQEDRRVLIKKLELHADLFISRWKKQSRVKRREILLQANPDLPEHRYRDMVEANISCGSGHGDSRINRTHQHRLRMLLPYLSLQLLSESPALLFALIYYRSRHTLEEWAPFDINQVHSAWDSGKIDVNFARDCSITYGPCYGQLVDHRAHFVHQGDYLGFPRAQLLLESQAQLMKFLLRMFNLVLEGANLDTPSSSKWSLFCAQDFRASADLVQWSVYTNAPYTAPPTLDLDEVISIAELRMNAIGDHLGLLQTDSVYMKRFSRLAKQDHTSKVLGYPITIQADNNIGQSIIRLGAWVNVKQEAKHAKHMHDLYRAQIHRGSPLPTEYDEALGSLELTVVNLMKSLTSTLSAELTQRTSFSHHYIYSQPVRGSKMNTMRVRSQEETGVPTYYKDPLFWCLSNLARKPDEPQIIQHQILFAFLEDHLASASIQERSRLDEILVETLSELAAYDQILLSIRLSRPRNKSRGLSDVSAKKTKCPWNMYGEKDAVFIDGRSARATRLRAFADLPFPTGKINAQWLGDFDRLHDAHRAYWDCVRMDASDYMKDEVVAKYLKADLDADHVAELALRRERIVKQVSAEHEFITRFDSVTMNDVPLRQNKNRKVKTRPKKANSKSPRPELEPKPEPQPESAMSLKSTVSPTAVTQRAATVFKRMYSTAEQGAGCDWDNLVLAMQDVGFTPRASTGSAVQFDLPGKGKIVFHRPHPVAKVDPIMLKAMGKRLTKWFGFGKDSFTA